MPDILFAGNDVNLARFFARQSADTLRAMRDRLVHGADLTNPAVANVFAMLDRALSTRQPVAA